MSYPLLSAGALNSLFFGVYGVSLRLLSERREGASSDRRRRSSSGGRPSNGDVFWAGCAGGVAQLTLACPVDLVKIKLQTQTDDRHLRFKGPYDVLRQIYRTQGVRGWYQGLGIMAWR